MDENSTELTGSSGQDLDGFGMFPPEKERTIAFASESSRVRYWLAGQPVQNYGDFLAEYFLEHLFLPILGGEAGIHILGSAIDDGIISRTLADGCNSVVFWGCGVRAADGISYDHWRKIQIRSVRGPLTASALRLGGSVPQGDPGLLMPALYKPRQRADFAGRSVCVPHFSDTRSDQDLLRISGCDVVLRPNLPNKLSAIADFTDALTSADFVLSSSLHGAIVAAGYGRPFAFWDGGFIDIPFKWQDFAASVNIPSEFCRTISDARTHYESEVRPNLKLPSLWPLLASSPLPLRSEAVLRVLSYELEAKGQKSFSAEIASLLEDLRQGGADIDVSGSIIARLREQEQTNNELSAALSKVEAQKLEQEALALVRSHEIDDIAQRAREYQSHIDEITKQAREYQSQIDEITKQAREYESQIAKIEVQKRDQAREVAKRAENHLAEVERLRAALKLRVNERDNAFAQSLIASESVQSSNSQLHEVLSSTSWRILGPFRSLGMRLPFLSRFIRRTIKVAWWTVTFQLGDRLHLWRQHRAALRSSGAARRSVVSAESVPAVLENRTPLRDLFDAFQALHGRAAIYFPPNPEPEVSIIIPAYRGIDELLACLRSLAVNRVTEPSFEVIVVDDSPDAPVLWALPRGAGLIGIVNEKNLGFLLSCKQGASKARGRVLCFLNSDTIVTAGWLRTLVQTLDETPRAAIAGSMLLNRDGTVQDAGWRIMWDGWGHPLGRGADARDGAYTYRRFVDCVTGACFCITRSTWDQLDGFDTAYVPAFYEEFDLAFRAKQKGLKVVYDPRSRVVHLGSSSYGAGRRDELSATNHRTFCERFGDILRKQPHDVADGFMLRQAGPAQPTILVIDSNVPVPEQHAGDVTLAGFLQILVEAGWRVVFGPYNGIAEGPSCEALEAIGVEMIRAPQSIDGWLRAYGRHVSHVWICRPELATDLIPRVRKIVDAPIAYYTHDLHHLRLLREAELLNSAEIAASAEQMRVQELEVLRRVDHILTPSRDEGEIIQKLLPDSRITVLPPYSFEENQIRHRDATQFEGLTDVAFVGGYPHRPNVDAALYIAKEVMPLIWRVRPEVRLLLIGYAPPPEVQELASDQRVIVTGQVPDLDPWFAQSRVMLAALRYGAGVKGKVVEAMRNGLPVVTTPIGAEGIGITPDVEAIVAEDAPGLAAGVLSLFEDATRCASQSEAAAALVARRFSRIAARATLEDVFSASRCAACGSVKLLSASEENPRESFVCQDCFALARCEALARVMLRRFARAGETSLPELLANHSDLRVHEFGFVGGIADSLRGFQNYSESEFFPDVPLGSIGPHGVRCEDILQLTYADESFDIVISQDVMEHVPDPKRAFAEIARTLRPGGSHIFTIPWNPNLPRSITRAIIGESGVEYLLPPEYHGDPVRSEGALVFTDYGRDLAELVAPAGIEFVEHVESILGTIGGEQLLVFEAIKRPS